MSSKTENGDSSILRLTSLSLNLRIARPRSASVEAYDSHMHSLIPVSTISMGGVS